MSEYFITPYTETDLQRWDSFIEASNNGTVFHRQDFLSYHPKDRFLRKDLMISRGEDLVALFPLAQIVDENVGKIGLSPYGSSFGGLITNNVKSSEMIQIINAMKQYFLQEKYHSLRISCPPSVYYKEYSANSEYFLLHSFPCKLTTRRINSVIDIKKDKAYSSNIKRKLKRSKQAGIFVDRTTEPYLFYPILKETIERKHQSQITHTLEELQYLCKTIPEFIDFFLGYHKDKPIAGIMCFSNSSPCATAFYNCFLADYQDTEALSAVFDYAIDYYKQKGKAYLDLGSSSMLGKDINSGLLQFKEGFGAAHYNRDYFELLIKGNKQ